MLGKLKYYLFGTIFRRGATVLTLLTFGSYLLGLARDMLFARVFGASRLLDIYNAAFIIPDLMLNIFVAGALTAAFVPIFMHLRAVGKEREADEVATTMIFSAPLSMLAIGLAVFAFMPWLSGIVAPGFIGPDKELLLMMTRLMLLSPIIFALSNTLGNMLISSERFLSYGLSPILYNLGIIAGIPLTKIFGSAGLVYGVVIGALLHLTIRVWEIYKRRFNLQKPDFGNTHFLKILKMMIPRMAGQPIEQLIFFIFTNMASGLFAGSIAILSFARNFQSVPVSLFGISFSTAVFASLSRKAALGDKAGFRYHFGETAKALVFTTIPAAIFLFFFGELIIKIFLGGGRFTETSVVETGRLLAIFSFAIPAESFLHLIARSFYALKDTWTPLLITVPGLGLIALLAKLLVPLLSLPALPLSYAAIFNLEAIILYLILRRKIQQI
ncbi:MAG: murein biosynthesis integral membrane protein MurJ [Candidatus Yanofskybacteria bacterium RIFCSPHIGHO2_01_FULL_45_42]|uniref:Murein biosynthesis integral membrane protein MurJ n=3 Tax=Candidatus Yanofskyibacteriota TaxID=1752733 RepID=A0A1F8F344_9BACT|nr:MAG: murein biosynthesis integral membrane protein MurJ [Candidatus Yanofskybacteria bacterium RIFCSPHIGHO2_01_FULL_45_42]OGN16533.1 MAG: murein biosynthesis integral membrane protein MurJ [Candidatus Yanofskybacteria bacterium RIFCSPHIGHO2_02_FULL_46_19]OGN26437.1 MAG: murein biosynthesis integral membrane protein MurJ [Candidatus Yanofskybacteria bacterium RIFCSPLOWO2_01_FULL_45_72]OGN31732.1 MAG: murein biosynthesis integral membrane protein MurJ [Candidatus Yanofskybacteria bacterium RIFC